ncbi:MAG: hypothetical protein GXP14_16315 [Gammaproteobacteria bacterium]|nr:hypothetical protein [Gammaproteobacteria bacterium]
MVTLKTLFIINSVSCISFGAGFLIFPAIILNFLSTDAQASECTITVIGAALILNGLHLIWTAQKTEVSRTLTLYFSVGDILWVVFTFILIFIELWVTTPKGITISIIVAVFIGALAIFQLQERKKLSGVSST